MRLVDPRAVAERFAVARPGYRLLACEPGGLPFYVVTAPSLLVRKQTVPVVDEFLLRSIAAGLTTPSALSEFLGVDDEIVTRSLTRLWQADLVEFSSTGGRRQLRLLPNGERALEEEVTQTPIEEDIWFSFDRLRWVPTTVHPSELIHPRDLRELGLMPIRPRKQSRPEIDELEIPAVNRAVRAAMRGSLGELSISLIKRIERAEQRYLPAHVLIFESDDSVDNMIEIVVDGRLDGATAAAIDSLGGATYLGISFDVPAAVDPGERPFLTAVTDGELAQQAVSLAQVSEVRRGQREVDRANGSEDDGATVSHQDAASSASVDQLPIRHLDTFEHPVLFGQARRNARRRLLVSSPWVKDNVVTASFVQELHELARRGVVIHVGYGIDKKGGKCDELALNELRNLHDRFDNVVVGLLGNTHAKVLIWDDDVITTSFNWMSFRGDQARTYRQEVGVLVHGNRDHADSVYDLHRTQIEAAAGKKARRRN